LTHFSEKGPLREPLKNFEGAGDFLVLFGHKKNRKLLGCGVEPHFNKTKPNMDKIMRACEGRMIHIMNIISLQNVPLGKFTLTAPKGTFILSSTQSHKIIVKYCGTGACACILQLWQKQGFW
jgi:hypothetical protein